MAEVAYVPEAPPAVVEAVKARLEDLQDAVMRNARHGHEQYLAQLMADVVVLSQWLSAHDTEITQPEEAAA